MSEDKRIIGASEVNKDENSNTYSIEYYLKEEELPDYVPEVGDVTGWTPVPARVSRFRKSELTKGYYILSIEAEPDDSADFFGSDGKIEITDKFEWKYEDRQFYYPPKIWGVRRATKDDVKKGAKNIYKKTAKLKDFIFRNYQSDPNLQGSVNYTESPFSTKRHPSLKLIGQKREWTHFTVVFYSEKAPKYLKRFAGINGKFPRELEVYNGSVPGKWRLRKQKLESYSQDGKDYVKVIRTFGYAWGGRWDPKKCIGYWKSWERGGIQEG